MKRVVGAMMSLVFVGALAGSGFAGALPRIEKEEYVGGGYLQAAGVSVHNYCAGIAERSFGSACFVPRKGEQRVHVIVEDDAGLDVAAVLVRRGMRDVEFCGSTPGAVAIPQGREFAVVLRYGECGTATPTFGAITVEFFRS